jgi:glycine betaine/proline transport system permease protein
MAASENRVLPTEPKHSVSLRWVHPALVMAAGVLVLAVAETGLLGSAPSKALVPLADWLSVGFSWFSDAFQGSFRMLSAILAWPLEQFRSGLLWLPWPTLILLSAGLGYLAGGMRLALFCAATFVYILVTGLWDPTAVTLALITVAVPLSAVVALLLGIASFRWVGVWRLLQPLLDLMQTIPTLAYLLPILALFGIGPMVAVVASAVVHGLQRVPWPRRPRQ